MDGITYNVDSLGLFRDHDGLWFVSRCGVHHNQLLAVLVLHQHLMAGRHHLVPLNHLRVRPVIQLDEMRRLLLHLCRARRITLRRLMVLS